jgi:putative protease
LGRLGDTPFELGKLTYRCQGPGVMAPRSVLNELRRKGIEALLEKRQALRYTLVGAPHALDRVRTQAGQVSRRAAPGPRLYVMARTLEQVQAVVDWRPGGDLAAIRPTMLYCDFEDVRQYARAADIARSAELPIGVATTRIILPGEEGFLKQIAQAQPDAVLVRNLAAVSFYREHHPELTLIGDYALNVANEITATYFAELGLQRLAPSYDLNWKQLEAMIGRINPALFEMVVHQHMPMFHMEHCVFAATLSDGKDYRDCGRPCEKHQVDLKDRAGAAHALIADVGCRNTVYNALAQSAAECIPQMLRMGLRHFRVELLRHDAGEVTPLLERYARVLLGLDDGRTTWRQLRVLNQLGVTRGTLETV